MKQPSAITGGVSGRRRSSLVTSSPKNVIAAVAAANCRSYANVYVSRCGFITDSQTHMITPSDGRFSMNGMQPTKKTRSAMSRMAIGP